MKVGDYMTGNDIEITTKNKELITISLDLYNKLDEIKENMIENLTSSGHEDLAIAIRSMSKDTFVEYLIRKQIHEGKYLA